MSDLLQVWEYDNTLPGKLRWKTQAVFVDEHRTIKERWSTEEKGRNLEKKSSFELINI